MASDSSNIEGAGGVLGAFDPVASARDYLIDLSQRSVLFWDVMRQRGNGYREHEAKTVPHVLRYNSSSSSTAARWSAPSTTGWCGSCRPRGSTIDPKLRPFVIVDPRAGHGPGIGGFKADSEIGVALKAGHTCYFVGFSPDPMPGQTIEDIALRRGRIPRDGYRRCTPRPTASHAWSAIARPAGR